MRSGALDRLAEDLADLTTLDPAALSDRALLDTLRDLHTLLCRLRAVQTGLIGAAHRRGSATVDGTASTQAWLRRRLHMGDTAAELRVATGLDRLPALAAAYRHGDTSFAHVAAVVDVARDIHEQVLDAGADALLAEHTTTLTPSATRRVAIRIRDHVDPDRRVARLYRNRWLGVNRTVHGAVSIQGVLDPEGGSLLRSTLNALTPPPIAGEARSPGTRRADALVPLCRLATTATPQAGGTKPHVSVTIDWKTLRDGLTPALRTRSGAWAGATLATCTPVHPPTARRLACDALLIPALLGSAGEPLDLGRATRVVSPALHHTLVREDGWSIQYRPDTNTVTARRPDGSPHDLVGRPHSQSP